MRTWRDLVAVVIWGLLIAAAVEGVFAVVLIYWTDSPAGRTAATAFAWLIGVALFLFVLAYRRAPERPRRPETLEEAFMRLALELRRLQLTVGEMLVDSASTAIAAIEALECRSPYCPPANAGERHVIGGRDDCGHSLAQEEDQ